MRLTFIISVNLAMFLILFVVPIMALESGETFIVTTDADNGPGTLRQALQDAQSGDSITFDVTVFPPDNPNTIFLNSPLPLLDQGNLIIDASNAGVVIDGRIMTHPDVNGLSILSSNNIIRGLHFKDFPNAGIALYAGQNIIGGDRNTGAGPSGRGNMITGTSTFGIGLWNEETSDNIVQGNIIGTDTSGTVTLGSFSGGIFIEWANNSLIADNMIGGYADNGISIGNAPDGYNTVSGNYISSDISSSEAYGIALDNTGFNTIGPSNEIINNDGAGIAVFGEEAVGNHITRNSIHDNTGPGIDIWDGGNCDRVVPFILDFDLNTGSLSGWVYPNSTVEIFSDSSDEGRFYEAEAIADSSGFFSFSSGVSFAGPHLTATATDSDGNTSGFSYPTTGSSGSSGSQEGNSSMVSRFQSKTSGQLVEDVRLGYGAMAQSEGMSNLVDEIFSIGAKRIDTGLGEVEAPIHWEISETEIPAEYDQFIDTMNENGIIVNYEIHWYDKLGHAAGDTLPWPRFATQAEIDEFLDYIRLIVNHYKGRVQYYTIWSEPDNLGKEWKKGIEPDDYVNLVSQTIPVIREIDPQVKIVTGPVVLYFGRDHLFTLLRSEAIAMFDVISTHPFYGDAPDNYFIGGDDHAPLETKAEYYYNYATIVDSILNTAYDHGFQGQYWASDLSYTSAEWDTSNCLWKKHTTIQAIKYYARGTAIHLGKDFGVESAVCPAEQPKTYNVIANLYTILAGTEPADLGQEIVSDSTNIVSYGFTHPNGDRSLALWTNGAAVDYDPGVVATLTIPCMAEKRVTCIDVLREFEQDMITEADSSDLIIRDFLVKDYPLFIMFSESTPTNIEDRIYSPAAYTLHQNYPNPFNPNTSILFQVPVRSQVSIKIYNVRGQEIRNLVKKDFEPGYHEIEWDGQDDVGRTVATGMYLIHMKSGDYVKTRRCLLLK